MLKIIFFSVLIFLHLSCGGRFSLQKYFHQPPNTIQKFSGYFVKPIDSNYQILDKAFGFPLGISDSVTEFYSIIYKKANFGDRELMYIININDTTKLNPNLGIYNFLESSYLIDNNKIYLYSIENLSQLKEVVLKDFSFSFPRKVSSKGSIQIIDNKYKTVKMKGFKITSIPLNKKEIKCLEIDIITHFKSTNENEKSTIFIHKKLGLLRWIRNTGRFETIIF